MSSISCTIIREVTRSEKRIMPRKKRLVEPPPLARYLTEELANRNLTLLAIEAATGIPDSTLSRIFSGETPDPKASQLAKIARAMGIPGWKVMARAGMTDEQGADSAEELQRIAAIVADHPELQGIMGKLTALGPRDLRAVRKYIELLKGDD